MAWIILGLYWGTWAGGGTAYDSQGWTKSTS